MPMVMLIIIVLTKLFINAPFKANLFYHIEKSYVKNFYIFNGLFYFFKAILSIIQAIASSSQLGAIKSAWSFAILSPLPTAIPSPA